MSKEKRVWLFLDLLIVALFTTLDQWTKYLAVLHLKDQPEIPIWEGVLELRYLENTGAAFGMLAGQKIFILFIALVFLAIVAYTLIKVPDKKKFRALHMVLAFLTAGAIGNMIDRIRLDYVVDFIYFIYIDFPIFNVADIYVTVATVVLFILLLFVYKEKDLEFLNFKQQKYRELK